MIVPLGMETVSLHRVPWVSIGIVVSCVVVFAATQSMMRESSEAASQLNEVLDYWVEHPYLELDPALRDTYVPESTQRYLKQLAEEIEEASEASDDELEDEATAYDLLDVGAPTMPDTETREAEQEELDEMSAQTLAAITKRGLGRWGLVPAKGFLQRGWVSSIFLHGDFWHLFGNMLLFAIVAVLLEDLWGRVLFPLFFVVGGLAGGIAHYFADPSSVAPCIGASGAIAACLGAFAVRFAREKVRFLIFPAYLWGKLVHVLTMPAWLWGTMFFGLELLAFKLVGTNSGVSNMAHIGGFAFGGGLALVLQYGGIEAKFIAPAVEKKQEGWFEHEGIEQAKQALAQSNRGEARRLYNQVLKDDPGNVEARMGLARLAAEDEDKRAVTFHVERLAATRVAVGDVDTVAGAFDELWDHVRVQSIRPPVAYEVAAALKDKPNSHAADLFEYLAKSGGELSEQSRVHLEEIRARDGQRPAVSGARAAESGMPAIGIDLPDVEYGMMPDSAVGDTERFANGNADPFGGLEVIEEPAADPFGGLQVIDVQPADEPGTDPFGGLEVVDEDY